MSTCVLYITLVLYFCICSMCICVFAAGFLQRSANRLGCRGRKQLLEHPGLPLGLHLDQKVFLFYILFTFGWEGFLYKYFSSLHHTLSLENAALVPQTVPRIQGQRLVPKILLGRWMKMKMPSWLEIKTLFFLCAVQPCLEWKWKCNLLKD